MKLLPFGPVAGSFYADNSRHPCIVGPIGSAKSTAAALRMHRHFREQPPDFDGVRRSTWAVLRNTYKALMDNTIPTWLSVTPEETYGVLARARLEHLISGVVDGVRVEALILFRALDDPSQTRNLLGMNLSGAWLNEAREFDKEVVSMVIGRCGRFPSKATGPGPGWYGTIADSNAWPTTSWLHDYYVVDPKPGFTLFRQPSGLSPLAENTENLPENYYPNLMQVMDKEYSRVHVLNEWGQSRSGSAVFQDYSDEVHCRAF